MDFNDTAEEAAFRAEARAWLETTLGAAGDRPGPRGENAAYLSAAKAYQAKKAAAGFAGLTWRKDVGGRELAPIFSVIFSQEEQKFEAPVAPFAISISCRRKTTSPFSACTIGRAPSAAQRLNEL